MPTLAEDILMKGSIQYTSVFCFCFFTLFFKNETDTYSGVNNIRPESCKTQEY